MNRKLLQNVYNAYANVNTDQWWNKYKSRYECKKRHVCEKDYVWNPATCSCENGKYLADIIDNSVIICDEVIDADAEANSKTKLIQTTKKEI